MHVLMPSKYGPIALSSFHVPSASSKLTLPP
ncbi:hypothetical protein E2C01_063810 [Portunus trituberculatus]|uniref:Uncharacterized protein n=1 Tax=Portunus trituberculatus TaxID=210409 RepID=A0A5B7HA54_PORTR|nr:hypothetical protein [Portunus trituberculatus]